MRNDKAVGVELRSIRIDGKDSKTLYETSWPDLGEILVNDKRYVDLKPL